VALNLLLLPPWMQVLGFFGTLHIVPLVSRYTLKAGLFGMDINKKGSREGEKKVPESLGLASGVVFLICIVLFQQLHYHDIPSLVHRCVGRLGCTATSGLAAERHVLIPRC
jgi:UDP-N-acetylglucosamine--dolichyl-phosphate N-acetylglucosaminephosphotransferase